MANEAYGITSAILSGLTPSVFKPSTCSIFTVGPTVLPSGQLDPEDAPVAVTGLADLPCRIGPMIRIRPTDKQERKEDFTRTRVERHVLLFGFYPTLAIGQLAKIGTVFYPIVGINYDGNSILTRLHLELVTA